jgi:transcriptional regulator with XRE-family HTH domain
MEASYKDRLKTHRQQAGLSLRQLGERLGVSFSSLARIERGIGEPGTHTRLRLEQWMDPEGEHPQCPCSQCAFPREHPFRVLEARVAMLEQRVMALEQTTPSLSLSAGGPATWDVCPPLHRQGSMLRIVPT